MLRFWVHEALIGLRSMTTSTFLYFISVSGFDRWAMCSLLSTGTWSRG